MTDNEWRSLREMFPPHERLWLVANLREVREVWRNHFEYALRRIERLPVPPEFRLIAVYEKCNSLRLDWDGAGELEEAVAAIAIELEDATQGPCNDLQ